MSVDEKQMARTEAIIQSMTVKERRNPDLINASRKKRIAAGAGVPISEVNALVKQFDMMKKMMKLWKCFMMKHQNLINLSNQLKYL